MDAYKVRRSLIEVFDFVPVNRDLVDGLAKVAMRESTMEALFQKIREHTLAEFKIAQKVIPTRRLDSSDMAPEIALLARERFTACEIPSLARNALPQGSPVRTRRHEDSTFGRLQ